MRSRLAAGLRRIAMGGAALAMGTAPAIAQLPEPVAPPTGRPRAALPVQLSPEDLRLGDLTSGEVEALRNYENRLFAVAREIQDPGLRATTLNRVARSKIIARDLEDAHTALEEAGRAAMEMPPGLLRDLRLMAISTNLVALAHEQVVEAVPNSPLAITGPTAPPPRSTEERDDWLDRAMEEWRTAAELASHITNPNYRSEQINRVVVGPAGDALKVGRDAGASESSRSDLAGQAPALYDFADRVLRQASSHAQRIDRAVWSDQALYEVAVAAGRAGLYLRAYEIARSIPRPTPRAEALILIAEAMAREAAYVGSDLGGALRRSSEALRQALDSARSTIPAPAPPGDLPSALGDLGLGLDRPDEVVMRRLEDLAQLAAGLRQRALELAVQAQSEAQADPGPTGLRGSGGTQGQLASDLAARAAELADAVAELRVRMTPELDRARALNEPERSAALVQAIPPAEDPALTALFDRIAAARQALEALSGPMSDAATVAYTQAARSVASESLDDLRAVTARLLTQSLINVGRFDDARAATALLPDAGHRYAIWGAIAESQGRRGLADSAVRWIDAEAPPEVRPRLYRRLEEGILNTVDQIRSQTSNVMGR
jgi:hypothetical protein